MINENIEDGQDLSVVRNQRLSNHVRTNYQVLQNFQRGAHDLLIPSIEGIYIQEIS